MKTLLLSLLAGFIGLILLSLSVGWVSPPQLGLVDTPYIPNQPWRVHDLDRPQPEKVEAIFDGQLQAVPVDALVLFDGQRLEAFENQGLVIEDGAMIMGPGGQQTKAAFGNMLLHVEWASPLDMSVSGQDRGNSGIKLMGMYEIQVLDSFENPTYADGQAGALYGQYPPMVNASRAPGQWQSYDIHFAAPKFTENGTLISPACVTILHNGVLIHERRAFLGPSKWRDTTDYQPHPKKLPLGFQWHRSEVKYRNIWLRELEDDSPLLPTMCSKSEP